MQVAEKAIAEAQDLSQDTESPSQPPGGDHHRRAGRPESRPVQAKNNYLTARADHAGHCSIEGIHGVLVGRFSKDTMLTNLRGDARGFLSLCHPSPASTADHSSVLTISHDKAALPDSRHIKGACMSPFGAWPGNNRLAAYQADPRTAASSGDLSHHQGGLGLA